MEQENLAILTRELSQPVAACVFSKGDLENLCEILQEWCSKALDEEIKHYSQLEQTSEQFLSGIASLKSGFQLKVTVQGADDERVYGTIPDVFNSPRFPHQIKTLYINSASDLRNLYNWVPRNRFEMFLDFTKPEFSFHLSLSLSISTPNASNVLVSGLDSTWVSGVYGEIASFIEKNKNRRKFFHRHGVYDLFLFLLGFPLAFSIAYKLSGLVNKIFGIFSVFVQNGAYVFIFAVVLYGFRILFSYARWMFPIVEYKNSTSNVRQHRYILGGLILAILGNFLYDLLKLIA